MINIAAEVARRNKLTEEAIELMAAAGTDDAAAELKRIQERKRSARERMDTLEKEGKFKEAATAAREAGLPDKAKFYRDLHKNLQQQAEQAAQVVAEQEAAAAQQEDENADDVAPKRRKRRRSATSRVRRRFSR
jgi:hypothetical protein